MQQHERAIRARLAWQPCPRCGEAYASGACLVLAHRAECWLLMAACEHCQHRAIFRVTYRSREHTGSLALTTQAAQVAGRPVDGPITQTDVDAMHHFLSGYSGGVQRLLH